MFVLQSGQNNATIQKASFRSLPGSMAAVVVAIRNKQYDAEEANDVLLDSKHLINPFPPESDWLGDIVLEKLMIDGWIAHPRPRPSSVHPSARVPAASV